MVLVNERLFPGPSLPCMMWLSFPIVLGHRLSLRLRSDEISDDGPLSGIDPGLGVGGAA